MSATPLVKSSGSQTAVINTEHTLIDTSDAGIYVLSLSTLNMAADDILALRIYKKINGGALEVLYIEIYYDAQDTDDLVKSFFPVAIASGGEYKATLKQTAGTGRAFIWEVLAI